MTPKGVIAFFSFDMPRTLSTALQTHLSGQTYTLATCWLLTRVDGTQLGFCSHDSDLVVGGITYASHTGASPSALSSTMGSGIDNVDIMAIFDSAAITEADLIAGLYDFAFVTVFLVNYADLTQGTVTLLRGRLGEVTIQNGQFNAELRSNMQLAQQQIGSVLSSLCRAVDFADSSCQYSGQVIYTPFTVTSVTSNRQFFATGITQADDFFTAGKIKFLTGANTNVQMEIKRQLNAGGSLELQMAMPYTVAAGDTFTLYRGCNRTLTQCAIYGNIPNFQGEPHIPGQDALMVQPK